MPSLAATTVRRGGISSRYWYETIRSVSINASSELQLRFSMSSKGGGTTDVMVEVRPEDFPTVLEMMSVVDRQAAMAAMASELARQVATQPERDARAIEEAKSKAVSDVQGRARDKYIHKPAGEDDRERTVMNGINEIVQELSSNSD
jgi:hypothetical protein